MIAAFAWPMANPLVVDRLTYDACVGYALICESADFNDPPTVEHENAAIAFNGWVNRLLKVPSDIGGLHRIELIEGKPYMVLPRDETGDDDLPPWPIIMA